MDKKATLEALISRCFAARMTVAQVCDRAGVSRATVSYWKADPERMTGPTVGKLEDALAAIEAERAA